MAQVDSSMYLQQAPIDFSAYGKGLQEANARELSAVNLSNAKMQNQQAKDQFEFNQGIKDAAIVDPASGRITGYDPNKFAALAQSHPLQAQQFQMQQAQQQMAAQKAQLETEQMHHQLASNMLGTVTPESYPQVKKELESRGYLSTGILPDQYDESKIAKLRGGFLDYGKQLQLKIDQQNADAKTLQSKAAQAEVGVKKQQLALDSKKFDYQQSATAQQQAQEMLESARGDESQQQARKDLYASKKIDSLISQFKDPNQMNNSQVRLLVGEIGKMATGGAPTEGTLKDLAPYTFNSKVAEAAEAYNNAPTQANLGKFISQLQNYSTSIAGDARNQIQAKVDRVLGSKKHRLAPGDYNDLVQNYSTRLMGEVPNQTIGGGDGSTKVWQGVTYVQKDGHWIPQVNNEQSAGL